MRNIVAKLSAALILPFALASLAACGGGADTSPAGVCTHYLTKLEKVEADKLEAEKKDCVEELSGMQKELGEEKWKEFSKCVLAASDKGGVEKCEPK